MRIVAAFLLASALGAAATNETFYQQSLALRDANIAKHLSDAAFWSIPNVWRVYEPFWECPSNATRIKIGGEGDGSKFMCNPAALPKDCVVYSFGSNGQFEFEQHLLELAPWCRVHTFDPTSTDKNKKNDKIQFYTYGLSDTNTNKTKIGPVKTLETIMHILGDKCVDVLKIDIELSEWQVIAQWLKNPPCFRQLLIELHRPTRERVTSTMSFLEKLDMRLFNTDPNPGCVTCMEFSFVRYSPERGYY